MFARLIVPVLMMVSAAPALAFGGKIQIPEPGDAALFVIAVVGLIVGRHVSRRAPGKNTRPDDPQV